MAEAWLKEGHTLDELDSSLTRQACASPSSRPSGSCARSRIPLEDLSAILAERLHPARLQAIGPYDGSLDDAAERAGGVADQFAAWGVDVVLEPLPFTNMQTPADAAAIILRADRPNLSMCMDVWHLYRMGLPLAHLDGLWPASQPCSSTTGRS